MGRIVYAAAVSLDGYTADKEGDIAWSTPDPELFRFHIDQARQLGASLYGRRLYEDMAGYWPTVLENPSADALENEFARVWAQTPKLVFSRTLTQVDWNSTLASGELGDEVARIKDSTEDDIDLGGPTLAAEFMRRDLIDEYQLFVHPIVLGGGTPFFTPLSAPLPLRFISTRTFDSGVVLQRYQRRREIRSPRGNS